MSFKSKLYVELLSELFFQVRDAVECSAYKEDNPKAVEPFMGNVESRTVRHGETGGNFAKVPSSILTLG